MSRADTPLFQRGNWVLNYSARRILWYSRRSKNDIWEESVGKWWFPRFIRCLLFAAPFALLCLAQYSPPSVSNTEIDSPYRETFCKNTVFVSFDDENCQNFLSIADFHNFSFGVLMQFTEKAIF